MGSGLELGIVVLDVIMKWVYELYLIHSELYLCNHFNFEKNENIGS